MTQSDKAPEGQVADAVRGNWVDRDAPAATRPYLRLSRADRPIGTWLLYIPCIWGILLAALQTGDFRAWDLWLILGCGAGAWLMRGAGCTWNDITDRKFDAQVARTRSRPIPSGQVTVRGALLWMAAQALIAFCILISFGTPAVLIGIASLGFVAIYPFAKRFTWWPQVFLGLAFNWGALLGWVAHNGRLDWPAVLLYLAGIAWTLFYDTIYAHQDTEDDALIGVKSTARLFGQSSPQWLRAFAVLATGLMAMAIYRALPDATPAQMVVAQLGTAGFAAHMLWQMHELDIEDVPLLLNLFRANREAGLIPVLFFAVTAML
ncbi:4-hydroxybenzoate octaprenyltransferase [Planktomarina sp.]|jgi:4-hydroxybenzoate polyprenyltransferase|nr:4-hydroxybenzoate octaprenyltransferase [Planktomarina sp.]MDB4841128.1 4-hydroxybenzoate octaprenyltransferase [Planktomarina sp.]